MINENKFYRTGKVLKIHPLIESAGYYWLLENIKSGKIKSVNTSLNGNRPRYKVEGKEIIRLIKYLKEKKK